MSQRMFVAVVPPQDVLDDLAAFLEPRTGMPWITPEQWHITLAFMAAVPERSVDDLVQRLHAAAARRHAPTISLAGAGTFPTPARAKVLWLGLKGTPEDLGDVDRLAVNVRGAANRAGAPVDGKAFQAHLTLARLHRPVEATRWLRVLDTYSGPGWTAEEFHLVASHLGEGPRRRPRHETVATFRLGTALEAVGSRRVTPPPARADHPPAATLTGSSGQVQSR